MTPDLLCMILLYGTWYDILGMMYSSAAAYFIVTGIPGTFAIQNETYIQKTERRGRSKERTRESAGD